LRGFHCRIADKDNLHRIIQELISARRRHGDDVPPERNCAVVDAALSLDVPESTVSADLLSILIGALSTTAPRECMSLIEAQHGLEATE